MNARNLMVICGFVGGAILSGCIGYILGKKKGDKSEAVSELMKAYDSLSDDYQKVKNELRVCKRVLKNNNIEIINLDDVVEKDEKVGKSELEKKAKEYGYIHGEVDSYDEAAEYELLFNRPEIDEKLQEAKDSDKPYYIVQEDFDFDNHFDKMWLRWYQNGVVTDENGALEFDEGLPVQDEFREPEVSIKEFIGGSNKINSVYVRDPKKEVDYCLEIMAMSYESD